MKKRWTTKRQWAISSEEKKFENLIKENGFEIIAIREYISKTDYLLRKDRIEFETSINREVKRVKDYFRYAVIERFEDICERNKLKRKAEGLADILYEHLCRDDQENFSEYLLDAGFSEKEINEYFGYYSENE